MIAVKKMEERHMGIIIKSTYVDLTLPVSVLKLIFEGL